MGWFIPPLTAAANAVRLGAGAPAWAKALYYGGAPLSGAAAITGGVSQIDFELNKHGLDWRGNLLPEESITQDIEDPYTDTDREWENWVQTFHPSEDDPYEDYMKRTRQGKYKNWTPYSSRLAYDAEPTTIEPPKSFLNKYGRGPLSAQPWDEFGWENDNSNSKINPNWVGELGDRVGELGDSFQKNIWNPWLNRESSRMPL
jgi:hypothetical protein